MPFQIMTGLGIIKVKSGKVLLGQLVQVTCQRMIISYCIFSGELFSLVLNSQVMVLTQFSLYDSLRFQVHYGARKSQQCPDLSCNDPSFKIPYFRTQVLHLCNSKLSGDFRNNLQRTYYFLSTLEFSDHAMHVSSLIHLQRWKWEGKTALSVGLRGKCGVLIPPPSPVRLSAFLTQVNSAKRHAGPLTVCQIFLAATLFFDCLCALKLWEEFNPYRYLWTEDLRPCCCGWGR